MVELETVMIRGYLGKVEIGTVGRAPEVENVMLTRQLIRMIDAMQELSHLPGAILNVIE